MTTPIRVLTVTVSDTRGAKDDESGALLVKELSKAGFTVQRHAPVRDDAIVLRELVRSSATLNVADAIVLTGGTGLAPRDVTPEAVEELLDKRIDGFGEEFRRRSWGQVGPRAMLSRATAGVVAGTVVIALPGSPRAVELAIPLIVEMLPHAVEQASGHGGHHSP
jgi:molybdenum cofactor biosynthesis protein B